MFPPVGMITLDRIIKDCEKKIAFRDDQMQDVEYLSDKECDSFDSVQTFC